MTKYSLIGAYYDTTTKRYSKETTISIPDIDLSTIQAIDNFTSSRSRFDILKTIKKLTGDYDINHLAIKCTGTNRNQSIYYLPIIEEFPEFIPYTEKKLIRDNYWAFGKYSYIYRIDTDTELFQKEAARMLEIIRIKDLEKLKQYYPYSEKDNFSSLVKAYISADPNNEESYFEKLIIKEFSNYATFRKWILTKTSRKRSIYASTTTTPNTTYPITKPISSTPKRSNSSNISHTREEYEEEYIQSYEARNGKGSYQSQYKNSFNSRLEDKEEFLTVSEIESTAGYYEEQVDFKPKTLQRTRKKRSSHEEND